MKISFAYLYIQTVYYFDLFNIVNQYYEQHLTFSYCFYCLVEIFGKRNIPGGMNKSVHLPLCASPFLHFCTFCLNKKVFYRFYWITQIIRIAVYQVYYFY